MYFIILMKGMIFWPRNFVEAFLSDVIVIMVKIILYSMALVMDTITVIINVISTYHFSY